MKKTVSASMIAILANFFLFIIKSIAAVSSRSVALGSDAINSLTDVISSVAILFAVKIAGKHPDQNHQYGHKRAEPLVGIMVAILACVLGLEVIRGAISSLISPEDITITSFTVFVVAISFIVKFFLFAYFRMIYNKHKLHPSLKSLSVDSMNDTVVSLLVLISFLFSHLSFHIADSIVAILIGLWIIRNGISIGLENSDFLMGKRPSEKVMDHIREIALSVKGVKGINDVFAHYVGPYVHAEIHIELKDSLKVPEAHDIGKKVQKKIESYEIVDRAFIHIDPLSRSPFPDHVRRENERKRAERRNKKNTTKKKK